MGAPVRRQDSFNPGPVDRHRRDRRQGPRLRQRHVSVEDAGADRRRINDICPADGYGAYIEFKVNFVGGGYGRTVRQDTATCGGAAKRFSFKTPKTKHKIKSVGVTVIELDNQNGVLTPGDAARKLLKNPRV